MASTDWTNRNEPCCGDPHYEYLERLFIEKQIRALQSGSRILDLGAGDCARFREACVLHQRMCVDPNLRNGKCDLRQDYPRESYNRACAVRYLVDFLSYENNRPYDLILLCRVLSNMEEWEREAVIGLARHAAKEVLIVDSVQWGRDVLNSFRRARGYPDLPENRRGVPLANKTVKRLDRLAHSHESVPDNGYIFASRLIHPLIPYDKQYQGTEPLDPRLPELITVAGFMSQYHYWRIPGHAD